MKKFLFSMICTLFPILASAQEVEPYAILIDDGTALEFRYDDMKSAYRDAMDIGPFTEAIQRGWDSSAEGIYSVVFNESFANCSTITSTAYWFAGLSNLETFVGLEYLNTSNVTNMYMMFYNCTSLASLDLSYFNTQNVTDMSVMFGSCNALTTIIVGSDWTTDHVEESGAMFESCFNLVGGNGTTFSQMNTDASYAHIDTEGYPGYFTASSSGDEPYWQELNAAIEHGSEVLVQARESGNVDQWMLEELEMFLNQGHEMYKEHTASAEEVRAMTEDLEWRIREVEEAMKGGGEGGEASEEAWAELHDAVERGDSLLTEAREAGTVEPWALEELENMTVKGSLMYEEHQAGEEEVRHMTEELNHIIWEVEEMMHHGGEAEPYAVLSEDNTILTFYYDNEKEARGGMDVGPFEDGGRTAGPGWSEFNEQITTVVFDESFANCTTLTSTAYWFYGCENLTTITDFNNLKTDNVTDINAMFSDCHSLTSIDFSSLNLSNVTNMSQVFEDCRTLESVNFRGVNTENVTNMSDLFLNCHNLRTVDLSSFNTRNVTNMSHMFCRCDSLTTIYVGEGWNTENVTESDQMFERSANLVGGLGTTYDENHIDIEYAHIDGGVDNPGYLTGINEREAYFDGLTAWVYGDATLNDAFAAVGREAAIQTVAAIVWEANGELTSEQLEGITNPNLLVYVNEASKAPADVQNVVIDGVAEEIILTDATGNNNFYCPQPFTAKSISYSRDFSQTTELEVSRGWETIALPFDVQSISHESHGTLVPFGGDNNGYHFWLRQLSEEGLERATQIEANKPYLISMPNNTVYPSIYNQNGVVTFSSTDVTVPETNPQSDTYADVTLHAAFQQVEQGGSIYALNVGETRGEYPEGSVFEQNYRDIRPFQAYTTHAAGTRFITLGSLGGDDGSTGIKELRIENPELGDSNGYWYSLDGHRLYVKPTKKGVYVKDGQKIVIK
jgi:surface protein